MVPAKATIANWRSAVSESGVRNSVGSTQRPMVAKRNAHTRLTTASVASALDATRDPAWWSSVETCAAIARVAATPIPRSMSENQPFTAENVMSSAQVPKAVEPRPLSRSGTVTIATTIAQTLPTPVERVLIRT